MSTRHVLQVSAFSHMQLLQKIQTLTDAPEAENMH